jgi:hypothetical protein
MVRSLHACFIVAAVNRLSLMYRSYKLVVKSPRSRVQQCQDMLIAVLGNLHTLDHIRVRLYPLNSFLQFGNW